MRTIGDATVLLGIGGGREKGCERFSGDCGYVPLHPKLEPQEPLVGAAQPPSVMCTPFAVRRPSLTTSARSGRKDSIRRTAGILALFALLGLVLGGCVARPTLSSIPESSTSTAADSTTSMTAGGAKVKTIYLAGGCFWGLEKYVGLVRGVASTEVGYANGTRDKATYGDGSGSAETVKIEYDPEVAPLPFLLGLYYDAIDPTSVNRQGNDVGTEYRSGIYYTDPADEAVIKQSLGELQKSYSAPIAIEVGRLVRYNAAEDYHQKYLEKNPGGYCHIPRKLFDAAKAARPE